MVAQDETNDFAEGFLCQSLKVTGIFYRFGWKRLHQEKLQKILMIASLMWICVRFLLCYSQREIFRCEWNTKLLDFNNLLRILITQGKIGCRRFGLLPVYKAFTKLIRDGIQLTMASTKKTNEVRMSLECREYLSMLQISA